MTFRPAAAGRSIDSTFPHLARNGCFFFKKKARKARSALM
jgi:hypothetical protein